MCRYCEDGPEPGWLWGDNGAPNAACPVCNPKGETDRAWELAEAQKRRQEQPSQTEREEKTDG